MTTSGIYKIQSIIKPERIYIGSSVNIQKRRGRHFRLLVKQAHHSTKLQRHFNKYGRDDLRFEVLLWCPKEDLIKNEQSFIDNLKPYFNELTKAGSVLGYRHTDEFKEGARQRALNMSDETKRKIGNTQRGRKRGPCTEVHKQRISKGRKGLKLSAEHRKKLSISHQGKVPWNKGKHGVYSDETRGRISQAKKGVPHYTSEETREKIRQTLTGKKRPPEIYKKMWETRRQNKVA